MKRWVRSLTLLLPALAHGDPSAAAPGPEILRVDRIKGYVELGVRGRKDSRERPGAGTFLAKDELKLDEILNLDFDGSVYYPRLLRYEAGLDLHFLQNLTSNDNQVLPGGFLTLNFLEEKPYGLILFGRVTEEQIEQTFAKNFDSRTESYGATIRNQLGPLPFRAGYTHRLLTRTGNPSIDLDERRDEVEFLGTYRLSGSSDGDVRYVFADETLRGQPSRRHEFVANNLTYFDPKRHKRFLGAIRYYDWSGRTNTSNASALTTYDWRHTDTLSSSYHFDYAHRTFDDQGSDNYSLRTALLHQLYGSLTSRAAIFGNIQDATSGLFGEYGLQVSERYFKRLGSWGRLGIGLAPHIRWQQLRPDRRESFVLDESVTFPFTEIARLRQLDIDTSSIVVTDTSGATIYQEGIDYLVTTFDRRTELERVTTGTIPAGGTVSVDYTYRISGSDNDIFQYGVDADLNLTYRDWGSFFVEISTRQEDVISGTTDRRLDDRDRQEFGFRTSGRWYSALVSFDWEDWDMRSSNGNLQSFSLSTPWPGRWQGGLSASHRGRHFDSPNERLEEWRAHANLDVRVGSRGVLRIDPEYNRQKWSSSNGADRRDLDSYGARASFQWNFRLIELRAEGSLIRVKRPAVKGLQESFFVRIRRSF